MDYKEIKVYLHTNLESLAEEKRTILLESSLLHHPDIKNRAKFKKYPSISREVNQNYGALSELDYQQRMEFFFAPETNLQLLRIFPNLFEKDEKKYSEDNAKKYFKQYNNVIKKNIEIMLTLLFIASPLNGVNVTSSWEFVVNKVQVPRIPTPYGFFKGFSDNTLIDINNKKYSFDRIIWMNDILNCPVYANLFLRFKSFMRWRENEYKKIKTGFDADELDNTKTKLLDNIKTIHALLGNMLENVTTIFTKFSDKGQKYDQYITIKNAYALYKLLWLKTLLGVYLKEVKNKDRNTSEQNNLGLVLTFKNTDDQLKKINDRFSGVFRLSSNSTGLKASAVDELISDEKKIDYLTMILTILNYRDSDKITITDFIKKLNDPTETNKQSLIDSIFSKLNTVYSERDLYLLIIQLLRIIKNTFFYMYRDKGLRKEGLANYKWEIDEKYIVPDITGITFEEAIFTGSSELSALKENAVNTLKSIIKIYNDSETYTRNLSFSEKKQSDINKKTVILDEMLQKTTSEIYKLYTEKEFDRDAQYQYFIDQYIRNQLSYQNKSTNRLLQELINSQNNLAVKKFFDFIKRVYEYYYEGKGEPFKIDDEETYLLFTGVNEKFESQSIENTWEIHVLCDLYLGASGKLYGEKNCELKSEELGKNLELVLTENVETLEKNRQKWDLNYRRILYSESAKQTQRKEDKGDYDGSKGFKGTNNVSRKPDARKPDARKPENKIAPTNLNPQMFQQVIDAVENKRKQENIEEINKKNKTSGEKEFEATKMANFNKEFKFTAPKNREVRIEKLWYPDNSVSYMEEINRLFKDHGNLRGGQPDFQRSNVLGILHDSKDEYERKLYDIYVDFNREQFLYNRNVANKLDTLLNGLISQISINRRDQEELLRTQNPEKNEDFLRLNLRCAKYYFYVSIVEELKELENNKQRINATSLDTPMRQMAANRGGRRRYKTQRHRKEKRAITRKTKYLRRRN
jgi:hypothetical protein